MAAQARWMVTFVPQLGLHEGILPARLGQSRSTPRFLQEHAVPHQCSEQSPGQGAPRGPGSLRGAQNLPPLPHLPTG